MNMLRSGLLLAVAGLFVGQANAVLKSSHAAVAKTMHTAASVPSVLEGLTHMMVIISNTHINLDKITSVEQLIRAIPGETQPIFLEAFQSFLGGLASMFQTTAIGNTDEEILENVKVATDLYSVFKK